MTLKQRVGVHRVLEWRWRWGRSAKNLNMTWWSLGTRADDLDTGCLHLGLPRATPCVFVMSGHS